MPKDTILLIYKYEEKSRLYFNSVNPRSLNFHQADSDFKNPKLKNN